MHRSPRRGAVATALSLALAAFATHATAQVGVDAQSSPPYRLLLPMNVVRQSLDGLPRPVAAPPTPWPSATVAAPATESATSTATSTATLTAPTPTDVPATATTTPPASRITGRVTVKGVPVALGLGAEGAGPKIELRRRQQGRWQKVVGATIGDDGRFAFENPPPLAANEAYQVWWDVDPNLYLAEWLTRWMSRSITTFGPGDAVDIGTLEVADTVELVTPENHSWTTLPATFSWRGRGLAGEHYRWTLARRCGNNSNDIDRDNVIRSEPFDRKTSYRLEGVPPGYQYDAKYCWYMTIDGADGGMGWSGYYRKIEFRAE